MIDCNEWRTEKRHECANMGKVKRLELWWQLYSTSLPVWDLENFRPMDFCWHECTILSQSKTWLECQATLFHIISLYTNDWYFFVFVLFLAIRVSCGTLRALNRTSKSFLRFLIRLSPQHAVNSEAYFETERTLLEAWCDILNCSVDPTRKFKLSKYWDNLNNVEVFRSYM